MECIQNADDNHYDDNCEPFLKFTIKSKRVQIECNETGFTEENVRSLCSACQSTKRKDILEPRRRGNSAYIGEKGIGFKSVFKIASRVHIASHPFFFQFDEKRELGMVVPIWDWEYFRDRDWDQDASLQTTIVLTTPITESEDFVHALSKDVENLRPTLLLFLNKLERLQFHVEGPDGTRTSTFSTSGRDDQVVELQFVREVNNRKSQTEIWNYFIFAYDYSMSAKEKRRPNAESTRITLAFPVTVQGNTWKPKIKMQSVFAYLPLGKFGFKVCLRFVIQRCHYTEDQIPVHH